MNTWAVGAEAKPRPSLGRRQQLRRAAQGEVEGCAVFWSALGPDAASMPVDDALHRSQPDTGTFEIVRRVEALEGAKELLHVFHLESRAVVADEIDDFVMGAGCWGLGVSCLSARPP